MQIKLCEKKDCTGCFACLQACKQGAIYKQCSNEGFDYPVIDSTKCIGCQSCIKSCPIISLQAPYKYNSNSPCFSAYHKHSDIRERSSSGGMFYTLAKHVIDQGGVVYGAAWAENLHLKHIEADDGLKLERLLRSKYVQSDTSEVFVQVKKRLDEGREVLFCGTPCQVAAMKSFLKGKEYNNILLVDVICQGVPSPTIFRKYINEIEIKNHVKVKDVVFRSKKYGWRGGLLMLSLFCEDGKAIEIKYSRNIFYRAFLRNYFLRPSCYDCQFKSTNKGSFSDITLADFWRIGNTIPYKCDSYEKGVSAVLTNTHKGEIVFDAMKKDVIWEERSYKEFSTNGGTRVAEVPKNNSKALEIVEAKGFNDIQKVFFPYTWRDLLSDWMSIHFSQHTIQILKQWIKR